MGSNLRDRRVTCQEDPDTTARDTHRTVTQKEKIRDFGNLFSLPYGNQFCHKKKGTQIARNDG